MRSRVNTFAIVSLCAAICFVALQAYRPTRAALVSSSGQMLGQAGSGVPRSCPVTRPPANPFVPPAPYPKEFMSKCFWFGTTKLWTILPVSGRDGLREKRFWWREGYDWREDGEPKLTVTGQRLDVPAALILLDDRASNGWTNDKNHAFIVDAYDVPTPGCWKMTARYEDGELSFIVWVTP